METVSDIDLEHVNLIIGPSDLVLMSGSNVAITRRGFSLALIPPVHPNVHGAGEE